MVSPFLNILKKNICTKFFKLINGRLPKHHKMFKMFNRNMIKLSYKCCRNIVLHSLLPIIEELSYQPLINMNVIVEIELNTNIIHTTNIIHKAVVNQKRNISVLQKQHLKIVQGPHKKFHPQNVC